MVLIMIIIRNRSVYLGLCGGLSECQLHVEGRDRIDASAEQDDRLRHCRVGGVVTGRVRLWPLHRLPS